MKRQRFEYTVACPDCGASKGDPCRSNALKWAYPHQRRSDLTIDAWRLGYVDGLRERLPEIERIHAEADYIEASVRERIEATR